MTQVAGAERTREHTKKIAVLLPCYNEEVTIGKVVSDFREALPSADVYVFDNRSDDGTAKAAADAGAIVVRSLRRGKGNVVKHMFRTVDADLYLMADGDDTYPAAAAGELIAALEAHDADMVIGTRLGDHDRHAFRVLHVFGNKLIARLVSLLFSAQVSDVLSGYRVFSRHLVQMLYLKSGGFEVETEITIQALVKNCIVVEVPIRYGSRPPNSVSKLDTWSDGWHVLKSLVLILKDYKPLVFFSTLGVICFVAGLVAGWYPIADYVTTRYVSHVPLALLAAALEILAVLFLGIGLILNAVRSAHMESQELIGNLFRLIDRVRRD